MSISPPTEGAPGAPAFEPWGSAQAWSEGAVRVTLGAREVVALREGALWLERERALIVSDLHLEKGSFYARRGQLIPPYDTDATLGRLSALAEALAPRVIVSLGDSFHDPEGPQRLGEAHLGALMRLTHTCEWIWIDGNHDGPAPIHIGGRRQEEAAFAGLIFRHQAAPGARVGEVSGHLHPCARIAGRGGAVRRRCFATDGLRLVMPAFGAFAGGLNVCDPAFRPIFPTGCYALAIGKIRLYPAPPERLTPDV